VSRCLSLFVFFCFSWISGYAGGEAGGVGCGFVGDGKGREGKGREGKGGDEWVSCEWGGEVLVDDGMSGEAGIQSINHVHPSLRTTHIILSRSDTTPSIPYS
jgi:hypothetical protein